MFNKYLFIHHDRYGRAALLNNFLSQWNICQLSQYLNAREFMEISSRYYKPLTETLCGNRVF